MTILEKFVRNFLLDYNLRLGSRIHKGFGEVTLELNEMFEFRYKN